MKRNSVEAGRAALEAALKAAEQDSVDMPTIGPMGSGYWYASLVDSLGLDRWQPAEPGAPRDSEPGIDVTADTTLATVE